MAVDKYLQIYDKEGNPVDYDIRANDVKFQDGEDLPSKIAEMEEEISEAGTGNYTKPEGGIPATDLDAGVNESLDKADTAYQKPASGIPATDMSQAVQESLDKADTALQQQDISGLATRQELNNYVLKDGDKVLSDNNYTNADKAAVETIPNKANSDDVYSKNESYSKDEVDELIENVEAGESVIEGIGDLAIVETNDYIDILILEAELVISPSSLSFDANNLTNTLTISGSHLKEDVAIILPEGFTASVGGNAVQSLPIVNGVLAETTVTIEYDNTEDPAAFVSDDITFKSGTAEETVSVVYSQYADPTIVASQDSATLKTGAESSTSVDLTITGFNLESAVSAALSGTDAAKFSYAWLDTPTTSGGTLRVTYSPVSGDSSASATLTLTSGAATKAISLVGAVSTLTVSEQSMAFSTDQGVEVTDTFTVQGTNLREDISITATGTGFSVLPASVAAADAGTPQPITVSFLPTAAGSFNGSITIQSSGVTETIALSGTAAAVTEIPANGQFDKDGIYYNLISDGNGGFQQDSGGAYKAAVCKHDHTETEANPTTTKYSGSVVIPDQFGAMFNGNAITVKVTKIANAAFRTCTGLSALSLPEGLEEIGASVFVGCNNSGFTSLVIPSTVTYINPANTFYNCSKLVSIEMKCWDNPDYRSGNWSAANQPMFYGCAALAELVVPNKVTGFMAGTFQECSHLAKITLGEDFVNLTDMFTQLTGLVTVVCEGSNPPKYGGSYGVPQARESLITAYVPDAAENDYATFDNTVNQPTAGPWKTFDGYGNLKTHSEAPPGTLPTPYHQ